MIEVIIRHRVRDYSAWKLCFDGFAAHRRAVGEKSFRIARLIGERDNLCLFCEWDSVEKAERFLASREFESAMREAGVTERPEIFIAEEVASGGP